MPSDLDPPPHRLPRRPPVRAWIGVGLAIVGVFLLWLGWYDVAGETLVARQLPFVASASIPGAALVIASAVLMASEVSRRGSEQAEESVAALYRLFTEEPSAGGPAARAGAGTAPPDDAAVVAVAGGTRYHRRDCPLVEGKLDVETVDRAEVQRRAMQPCPVCAAILPES